MNPNQVRLWERAMPQGEVASLYKATNETSLRRLRDADETLDHDDVGAYYWLKGDTQARRCPRPPSLSHRGTSLTRKRTTLGPYRRPMPRVLGGWAFSYERGAPVR